VLLRRFLLVLGLAVVLGCSGSTSLIIRNLTGKPISGSVEIQTTYARKAQVKKEEFNIAEGGDAETVSWFKDGPDYLKFEYSEPNGKPIRKEFSVLDYPPGMLTGTSAGAWYFMEVRDTGLTLRGPTKWEVFQRNPQYTLFPLAVGSCGLIFMVLLVWLVFRNTRGKGTPPQPDTIAR
jgi:hypothetical protein